MKNKFFISVIYAFSFLMVVNQYAESQTRILTVHSQKARSANINALESNLNLLNLCDERPDYIQKIYRTAFQVLEADRHANFADVARNEEFLRLCRENGITHSGGPMLGNISPNGAQVWIRTLQPARVDVRVSVDGAEKSFGPVYSTEATDLSAVVNVTGLKAGQSYPYRVFIDEKPAAVDSRPYIRTTPEESERVRIAFGTCYHRWGLCNQTLADQIKSREPYALLLGGDLAVQDKRNHFGLHRADNLLRDFHPAWKNLVSSLPVYATWDDHDYFDNDLYNVPGSRHARGFEIPTRYTQADKEAVWRVWRDSWNNPYYGFGEDGKGVFFRTRIGPADVIMLDNRYFREKGSFLGDEQMKWLKEQLLNCEGPFIILFNGTMWSDYVSDGKDSWGAYDPEGRERLFQLIEENNIGGVLLISGDRHGARGFKIPRPSGFTFYEFEVASLGARTGPPPIRADWDTQLYGITGEYAFGEFDFDTSLPDPEVTFRLIHERGAILYEITLTQSELMPR